MSGYLWKAYLEDDFATFRSVLENSGTTSRSGVGGGGRIVQSQQFAGGTTPTQQFSNSFGASPGLGILASPPDGFTYAHLESSQRRPSTANISVNLVLTRSDLNHRDSQGRTLLHHVASSTLPSAPQFANALLEHPFTDIYMQDRESGWTALHRAFYAGNISIALAIMTRDAKMDGHSGTTPGGLVRIKDSEGNGPFDVLEQTLDPPKGVGESEPVYETEEASESEEEDYDDSSEDERDIRRRRVKDPGWDGQEVFTFGSNKNINLGFGDEDDRQFPEKIVLKRPKHLIRRLVDQEYSSNVSVSEVPISKAPFMIRNKPFRIRNIVMGKYSTAIITNDPVSNLHICGHGSGGRLGLGDELARFQFTCVDTGSLSTKKIRDVALGDHHTIAVTDSGQTFSWGTNSWGQLGYDLPANAGPTDGNKKTVPLQLHPRQIYGPIKREEIFGVAASAIHTALCTSTTLYTFGKNEGQLGTQMNADARLPAYSSGPKKVARDFQAPITAVAAIDRATVCLLKNCEVWVFANYGYTRLNVSGVALSDVLRLRLRGPLQDTVTTRTGLLQGDILGSIGANAKVQHRVKQIAANGDTICLRTTLGDIFSLTVSKTSSVNSQQEGSASVSTTNPSKIKSSLSTPMCIWSNRKARLAARHVDVDQNGAVILATEAGSVWRRVPRAKISSLKQKESKAAQQKEYKFSRIPGLTSVLAVRASGYGAYGAIKRENDTIISMMHQIGTHKKTLQDALFQISAFRDYGVAAPPVQRIRDGIIAGILSKDKDILGTFRKHLSPERWKLAQESSPPDVWLMTTTCDLVVPTHRFMLAPASPVLGELFQRLESGELASEIELDPRFEFTIEDNDGMLKIIFQDYDILMLVNLAIFLIVGTIPSSTSWCNAAVEFSRVNQELIAHGRSMKVQLLRMASRLQMLDLETAVKSESTLTPPLIRYFQSSTTSPETLPGHDIVIKLDEDEEMRVHSALMVQMSPFFNGLFWGRSEGRWVADRRVLGEPVKVDLKHISKPAFEYVARWIYSDSETLFDSIVASDTDDYLEQILEVLDAANELLLEPLAHICQIALCNQINVRNICYILTAVSQSPVSFLKNVGLEYLCQNLEAVLRHGHIEELDEDLLPELDEVARKLQSEMALTSRWVYLRRVEERHPDLQERRDKEKRAKIDSIVLLNKYSESYSKSNHHHPSSFKAGSFLDQISSSPTPSKPKRRMSSQGSIGSPSPSSTPLMEGKIPDMIFDMDDDKEFSLGSSAVESETTTPELPKGGFGDRLPSNEPISRPSLKDIMAQDASSSLPGAFASSPISKLNADRRPNASFATSKLSQKERKKLQQQMQLQPVEAPIPPPLTPMTSGTRPSPWKTVSKPKSGINELEATSPASTSLGRSAPQLTMRQTIANPGTTSKDSTRSTSISTPSPISNATPRKPSADNTRTPTTPRIPSSSSQSTTTTPIQIQSIRHTPLPRRPSFSTGQSIMSMSDIQSQQAKEKERIMGGGEKKSLAEIQAEQEFQEWWDKESARVQNEEKEKERKDKQKKSTHSGRKRAPKKEKGKGKVGGDNN